MLFHIQKLLVAQESNCLAIHYEHGRLNAHRHAAKAILAKGVVFGKAASLNST
jgi:hypothetical protein